ncbi:MAG: hypothetical protein HC875_28385 [Anaerolineales bacterium]|nr:hypothetical protein [Anaerolineales bacterium]
MNFDEPTLVRNPSTPKGYKGLAGFHKYWGKKPIEAWGFLIETLTQEKEIILDPFLGSGLIAKECIDFDRRFIGFDINPFSIELTKVYLNPPDYLKLRQALDDIEKLVKPDIDSLYLTSKGEIVTHFLWEKDKITKVWTKHSGKRVEIVLSNKELADFECVANHEISIGRKLNLFDNSRINSKNAMSFNDLFTYRALMAISHLIHSFDPYEDRVNRALKLILTASLGQMSKMVFAVTNRGKTKELETENIEVGSWVIGYWRPEQHFEINAWNCFENKANRLLKALKSGNGYYVTDITNSFQGFYDSKAQSYLRVGDSEVLLSEIPDETVKLILTDPPHGDRIPYLELSEMWNAILDLDVNFENELVVSNAKGRNKNLDEYNSKLSSIFSECNRVLEPDGLLAIMFNARSCEHWDSLHALEAVTGLEYIGCYPMEYSAGSVVQDNRKGSLKSDYVLLYGKQVTNLYKKKIMKVFNLIDGWMIEYPKNGK